MADPLDQRRTVQSFVVDADKVAPLHARALEHGVRRAYAAEAAAASKKRGREDMTTAAPATALPFDPAQPFDADLDALPSELSPEAAAAADRVAADKEEEAARLDGELRELQAQRDELIWLLGQVNQVEHGERQVLTTYRVEKVARQTQEELS